MDEITWIIQLSVCNESWQQLTDFNANFKQNSLNAIQKRHTVGSAKRIKQTNFGLQEPKEVGGTYIHSFIYPSIRIAPAGKICTA